jgi:capsular exopolysaccharide synthesis family protein
MDAHSKLGQEAGAQLEAESPEENLTLSEVIEQTTGLVRRRFPIFVFITACCFALGLVYLFTTPPSYTSHAMLLIDSSKLRLLQEQQTPLADVPIDTAQVETQVEILKSENIALSVIKEMKLTEDPEFVGASPGLLGWLLEHLSQRRAPDGEVSQTKLERRALAAFFDKRSITRVGRTYVLDVGFTSLNAARAAAIANAIGDAYIVDQLEAKYQATKRASGWLQDRITDLRKQATDADRAVLDYKEKNKIISVRGASSVGGPRLLGEQQLEDLNTQLGTARAAAEDAKAKLEQINDVMQRDVPITGTDSLRSEVINKLRDQYLEIAAKEAVWSARYGKDHLAAVNLRTQMAELRRAIRDELGRIAESYNSDYEIAKARVGGLERELQRLVASSQVTNRDRVGLTDLESTAKVYHSIYDNFLQKFMEAIQQQSFPITEARVISVAAAPERKSAPSAVRVLGVACFIGIMLSFGAATVREALDKVFRTPRDIESTLHIQCLAVLPRLGSRGLLAKAKRILAGNDGVAGGRAGSSEVSGLITSIINQDAASKAAALPKEVAENRRLQFPKGMFLRQVVDEPLSAFAEAFRSIKIAADINGAGRENKVIGIISTVPREGKSTVAVNFAELIAHSGKRVILLDADLRNPALTRTVAPPQLRAGLLEVLKNQACLNDVICADEQTGMRFIPAVSKSHVVHAAEILASTAFDRFVDSLREKYDYVILDLPPLGPVVDARATTRVVDAYIYVIEWGKTPKSIVQQQLRAAPEIYDRLLGAVLNKSNLAVMQRYENYKGYHYEGSYYGSYHNSA